MQKIIYLIIVFILIIIVYLKFPRKVKKIISQPLNNQEFLLEVANNSYLQSKGLSKRTNLCPNCGMIFVFNYESIQTFWMKDTLIPLDIIFINSSGRITNIFTANPEPGKNDFQLSLYQSSSPVKYVIELNAGTSANIGLKAGDHLKLNL